MNTILPELLTGQLTLILASKEVKRRVTNALVAYLALKGPVRVLDAGNCFDAHGIAVELRRHSGKVEAHLRRIHVARAFTCYQVLALLAETPLSARPTVVLDLLTTFLDESVPLDERRRLLGESLTLLHRLSSQASVAVSAILQPASEETQELQALMEGSADQVRVFESEKPRPPLRLF